MNGCIGHSLIGHFNRSSLAFRTQTSAQVFLHGHPKGIHIHHHIVALPWNHTATYCRPLALHITLFSRRDATVAYLWLNAACRYNPKFALQTDNITIGANDTPSSSASEGAFCWWEGPRADPCATPPAGTAAGVAIAATISTNYVTSVRQVVVFVRCRVIRRERELSADSGAEFSLHSSCLTLPVLLVVVGDVLASRLSSNLLGEFGDLRPLTEPCRRRGLGPDNRTSSSDVTSDWESPVNLRGVIAEVNDVEWVATAPQLARRSLTCCRCSMTSLYRRQRPFGSFLRPPLGGASVAVTSGGVNSTETAREDANEDGMTTASVGLNVTPRFRVLGAVGDLLVADWTTRSGSRSLRRVECGELLRLMFETLMWRHCICSSPARSETRRLNLKRHLLGRLQ